jgi:hypothetical protein
VVTKAKGIGTFNPIKISVFDLLLKYYTKFYYVFYQEEQNTRQTQRVLLFKIKLE